LLEEEEVEPAQSALDDLENAEPKLAERAARSFVVLGLTAAASFDSSVFLITSAFILSIERRASSKSR